MTDEVAGVLQEYNQALNAATTDAIMPLYLTDGIFMPPYSPSAIGTAALRKAYDDVFAAIRLTVTFHVAEIVAISPDWAFARTNSAGSTLHHDTGETTAEANQELFLFQRDTDGKIKIARYSFSSTKPPK